MFFVSCAVALASQASFGLIGSDFRVSAGIISFMVLLFYYKELKPIPTGILSGIMIYLLRLAVYYISEGHINDVIISYQQEIVFYIIYPIIYLLLNKKNEDNINFVFLIMVISDFCSNYIEVLLRYSTDVFPSVKEISITLIIVSVVRSAVVWLILNGIKYYRMLLIKEEHEDRYKKLLWLTSQLRSEMYWMEKSMELVENVMSESYELYEKINVDYDRESWGNRALTIAREIHEIKKENGLIIRGVREITENELKDKSMDFKNIISILSEAMNREIKSTGKDINLIFETGKNFYISKHYYIMSVFRNLIMNSIEAIPENRKGSEIIVRHEADEEQHNFIVSDNYGGINKETLKHIFSPGFSTKINYSTGEVNRGLGLSLVKYIVEDQLGGKVSVSSVEGKETAFRISIPKKILEERER